MRKFLAVVLAAVSAMFALPAVAGAESGTSQVYVTHGLPLDSLLGAGTKVDVYVNDGLAIDDFLFGTTVGPLTLQFIRMYARDPLRTALALHDGIDLRRCWREHFPRITFLRTERLTEQLPRWLMDQGYSRRSLGFVHAKERVNRTGRSRQRYFTPALANELRQRERLFYQVFPDYLRAFDAL